MLLTPRPINPGWARRWTKQSLELFYRQPNLFLANATLFLLANGFIPGKLQFVAFSAVLLVGILFSSLRAADHNSAQAWSTTYHYFRQTLPDLLKLSFVICIALYLTQTVFNGIMEGVLLLVPHALAITQTASRSTMLPFWLQDAVEDAPNVLTLGIIWPGMLQLIFLTQAVGHAPLRHFQLGHYGAMLNPDIAYRLLAFGFLMCVFLTSVFTAAPSLLLGYVLMGVFAFLYLWLGSWGYLWCREMFEGTRENARATLPQNADQKRLSPIN